MGARQTRKQPSFRRVLTVWRVRFVRLVVAMPMGYLLIVLIGSVPINRDFIATETPDGVEIFITSNAVHADLVLPIENGVIDWRREFDDFSMPSPMARATHMAIGWGDRGFFLETPTWDDLRVSTAANALLVPSTCCLHVQFLQGTPLTKRSVRISNEQYEALVGYINRSFRRDADHRRVLIDDKSYGANDVFFEAIGNYHILNTCNSWVGGGLKAAGVKCPWVSPLPGMPEMYLPQSD